MKRIHRTLENIKSNSWSRYNFRSHAWGITWSKPWSKHWSFSWSRTTFLGQYWPKAWNGDLPSPWFFKK